MRVISVTKDVLEGSSLPQILAILSSSLAVVTSGFLFAWGSPFITKIVEDKETYNITEDEASYFTVLNLVSMLLAPFIAPVMNIIGRKNSLLLTAIPFTVSLLIKAFTTNLWLFYISRLCYGLGDAILYCTLPVYIGEISTPKIRGTWGNSFSCGSLVGYFLINVMGTYLNVQSASFIGLIFPILFFGTFIFMPESPYYYAMKDLDEYGKDSLRTLRGKYNVDKEFEEIKAGVKRQMSEAGTWSDLFLIKSNKRALTAGVFLRISQELSGVYVFNTYIQYIFNKSVSDINSNTSAMIYSGLVVIFYTTSAFFSDRIGRRYSYMVSMSLAAVIDLAEGIYFYLDVEHPEINLDYLRWFPLFGLILFAMSCSFGLGVIPSLMASELFSTSIKSKAISLVIVSYAVGVLSVNICFYYLNSYFGMYAPFLLFSCCNIVSTILTYFVVPETNGKTLEEIQIMLKKM